MPPAAVGFSVHTGWAAAVVVAGTPSRPLVVDRRRVELAGVDIPKHVYHVAQELPIAEARKLVERAGRDAIAKATEVLKVLSEDIGARGHRLEAVAVLEARGRIPGELEAILKTHALVHGAEGELYRRALREAARARKLRLTGVAAADVVVAARIAALRSEIGGPWAKEQQQSATAAWVAL